MKLLGEKKINLNSMIETTQKHEKGIAAVDDLRKKVQ